MTDTSVVSSPVTAAPPPAAAAGPASVSPPVAAPVSAEPPAPAVEPAAPALSPTLLSAPPEPKVEEPFAPNAEPPSPDAPPEEPPPAPPAYEPFALPEDVKLSPERLGEFTSKLGAFETLSKADHAAMQQFGQELVDQHLTEVARTLNDVYEMQRLAFEAKKQEWKDAALADPVIGGNDDNMRDTILAARRFVELHGGSDAEQAELIKAFEDSGLGNHRLVLRLFAQASRQVAREGKPLGNVLPMKSGEPKSKVKALYG